MIDLDRLTELEKAATPGPWTVDETKALGAYGIWTDYATHPGWDKAGYQDQICAFPVMEMERPQRDANAYLLAELRNNAPALLEALVLARDNLPKLFALRNGYGELEDKCHFCHAGRGEECDPLCFVIKFAALLGKEPPHV